MTNFLYDNSNLLFSAGSVLDLFGVLTAYNTSNNPQEADRRTFHADISTLKSDMDLVISLVCMNV